MSDFLPRDVLIGILARLPVNTLVRCSCVCKSWFSLITNPSFITKHLNHPSNNDLLLVRSYSDDGDGGREHYSLRCDNDYFSEYGPELHFPLKSFSWNNYFRIIGSCNGVICLSDDQFTYINDLFLWNPSIRKMTPLPRVRVTFRSHGAFMHSIGFGFDPLTDDYKVVRIVHLLNDDYDDDDDSNKPNPPEIDIFTVSSGNWRNISDVGLGYSDIIIDEKAPQAFLKGAAHWIASSSSRGSCCYRGYLIVSFDMGREEFGQIMQLPPNIIMPGTSFLMLLDLGLRVAKFQESLAVMYLTGPEMNVCCIWVMKEYGVAESWTKQFNVDMSSGGCGAFNSVAGFTRKGELLLTTSAGHLVAQDPQARGLTHLFIRGCRDSTYRHSFYADAYRESLVLLGKRFCDTLSLLLSKRNHHLGMLKKGRVELLRKSRTGLFWAWKMKTGKERVKMEKFKQSMNSSPAFS